MLSAALSCRRSIRSGNALAILWGRFLTEVMEESSMVEFFLTMLTQGMGIAIITILLLEAAIHSGWF